MKALAVLLLFVGLAAGGAILGRIGFRRASRIRRLESAETEVVAAVADGRLERESGEAMLQHIEGLRRECSAGDEG